MEELLPLHLSKEELLILHWLLGRTTAHTPYTYRLYAETGKMLRELGLRGLCVYTDPIGMGDDRLHIKLQQAVEEGLALLEQENINQTLKEKY